MRAYFSELAAAHDGGGGAAGVRLLPDYIPEWLLTPFSETPLHDRVLHAEHYAWHPLRERTDAHGVVRGGGEAAAYRIYTTCVNRIQRAHALASLEWLPEQVHRAAVHLLDQHALLTLHMEERGEFTDEELTRAVRFGGGRNVQRLNECESAPETSAYEELMPREETAFEWGALPDLIMLVTNAAPLWGEHHDSVYADPAVDCLIKAMFKSLPVPFRKRDLAKIVSLDVRTYPTIYNVMLRLLMATLLGSYEHARVPCFEARREIYRRFALRPMSPNDLAAWLRRNEHTTRYVLMEYLFFAIESVPPLARLFKRRYNWETITANVHESCEFFRQTVSAAVRRDQRDWLLRAARIRVLRQPRIDPLAVALRDATVRQVYALYPDATLWSAAPASLERLRTVVASRSEADSRAISLLEALARSDIFRQLAHLLRTPLESLEEGESSALREIELASGETPLGLAIDEQAPARSVARWLEMASASAGASAFAAGAVRSEGSLDAELHNVVVSGVASLFGEWFFGVEEYLDQHHKGALRYSYRPVEQHFVRRALILCNQLDDRFYANERYRARPSNFTSEHERAMREVIFKFAQDEPLQFDWLVIYGVSMNSIKSLRAAQLLFCSETLRAQIGTTLEAMLLTRYHDYYVLKRFFYWRQLHMSIAVYDLPIEVTRNQITCFQALRHSTHIEPHVGSYHFCMHCRRFKALYTGHPSDPYPIMNGSRRKRVRRQPPAEEAATAASPPPTATLDQEASEFAREQAARMAAMQAMLSGETPSAAEPKPAVAASGGGGGAASKKKRACLVDVSNRTIDPRHRTAIGSVETFYNPSDQQVYCKNMNLDTEQRIEAYRLEAEQRLQRYAETNRISRDEAVRWITILKPKQRVAAWRQNQQQHAHELVVVAHPPMSSSTTATTYFVTPEALQGTGQRRAISTARKRRGLVPLSFDALAGGANMRSLDPQHFKRISKYERRLRDTAPCGFEPLPQVNLIGRLFFFFGKLFFKCPRCVAPSIATYHCSKLEGPGGLSCTFCNDDLFELAGPLPRKRFRCHICENTRPRLAAELTQHLVLDDDQSPPTLRVHQFCRSHSRVIFSSAGTILKLSRVREALDAGWHSMRDQETGVRTFVARR